ncbi:MAG TPA: NAD(P)H-binding protein, partial [Thermodesulfovibrionales bacterium]|nr:NAD(P)H-binding protein [Thermodesulfovibrionales bacterium]
MNTPALSPEDRVIIFGSTGFVGSALLPELMKHNIKLRLFVRDKARVSDIAAGSKDVEIFQGDLLSGKGLK